jgi:hypothetical protein
VLAAAFAIAVLATPPGISGAVLLLPFQVSVLGTPGPAVTPANLLYNVVATPGDDAFAGLDLLPPDALHAGFAGLPPCDGEQVGGMSAGPGVDDVERGVDRLGRHEAEHFL